MLHHLSDFFDVLHRSLLGYDMLELAHIMLYPSFLVSLRVHSNPEFLVIVVFYNIFQLLLVEIHQLMDNSFLVPKNSLGLIIVCS
jgi:hypothetical protein